MNKAFEKILERLEQKIKLYSSQSDSDLFIREGLCISKVIVQEVEEEYNDGWIPCSERLPEDYEIHEVTAKFSNGRLYNEFAYYDESKEEWWKHDESGIVSVIAWKEHTELYLPDEK